MGDFVFPPKLVPYEHADGYWGEGVHQRIQNEEIAGKIRVLHQDKIVGTQSPPVALYLPVVAPDGDACTCTKETAPRGESRCRTCHATKRAPGYRRFLHETVYACSSATSGWTLTNVVLDTEIKPHRLRLADAALTGTIVTTDRAYSNTDLVNWTSEVVAYAMVATDTILVEFSTDAGATWTAIAGLNGAARPNGAGVVRFRITLTRLALETESPCFEIVRIRHPVPSRLPVEMRVLRPEIGPGDILILRTWAVSQTGLTMTAARQTDHAADRSWTLPLDFFDSTITRDTPTAGIVDNEEEQAAHPFYVHTTGVNTGRRYVMFQFSYNETLGIFTHQAFAERAAQAGEAYGLIW